MLTLLLIEAIGILIHVLTAPCVVKYGKQLFDNSYLPIQETVDVTRAVAIYQLHGVGRKKKTDVCQSIDGGKSNFILGEIVCSHAIKRLYPTASLFRRVECMRSISVLEMKYDVKGEHATETRRYHRMAKCYYAFDKSFYIVNAPKDDFYYVIEQIPKQEDQLAVEGVVKSVLKIKFNKKAESNLPQVHDTADPLVADDIFGVFGSIIRFADRSHNHLCEEQRNGKLNLLQPDICQNAIQLDFFKAGNEDKVLSNIKTSCVKKGIIRRLINFETNEQVKTKESYLMVTCTYLAGQQLYEFDILNGPTNDLFYILQAYLKDGWIRALLRIL